MDRISRNILKNKAKVYYKIDLKEFFPAPPLKYKNEIILIKYQIPYIIDAIHSNDISFYNLSETKSDRYSFLKKKVF